MKLEIGKFSSFAQLLYIFVIFHYIRWLELILKDFDGSGQRVHKIN